MNYAKRAFSKPDSMKPAWRKIVREVVSAAVTNPPIPIPPGTTEGKACQSSTLCLTVIGGQFREACRSDKVLKDAQETPDS